MNRGDLDHTAEFQARPVVGDPMGDTLGDWAFQCRMRVKVRYLKGGETVIAARLDAKNPIVLTMDNQPCSRRIGSDWRVVITDRTGITKTCEVKESPRPTDDSRYLDLLCEG